MNPVQLRMYFVAEKAEAKLEFPEFFLDFNFTVFYSFKRICLNLHS